MKLRILTSKDVDAALSMGQAIQVMEQAFAQFARGKTDVPLRGKISTDKGTTLMMPAWLGETRDLGIKLLSIYHGNPDKGLPSINGMFFVFDPDTGIPSAMIEAGSLTALRTGALGGLGAKILSRENSSKATIFGAGPQAEAQLIALFAVRPITHVTIISRSLDSAEALAEKIRGFNSDLEVETGIPVNEAVASSDIIVAATNSHTPVFDGTFLQSGTHITGVGSFTPDMQEVDATTLESATIVVDELDACMEEAGELIANNADIHAEIGEIIIGEKTGRTRPDEITFFKTVGIALQDAAVAGELLRQAEGLNLGKEIDFF